MGILISDRTTQFAYFDCVLGHPVWKGRKVLDFGGNVGGFLAGAGGSVDHDDYWCIDLFHTAIARGRKRFPRAHFVHYNRYNSEFNPDGVRYLPVPNCGVKFDIILAFSVFTHTHQNEMLDLVGQLQGMLAPAGVLAVTFTDQRYDLSLSDPDLPSCTDVRWNLERRRRGMHSRPYVDAIVKRAGRSRWCVLIDGVLYVEPGMELCHQERVGKPWESYCSYYRVDYMAMLFPEAKLFPPVSPEWQHCCVIRN